MPNTRRASSNSNTPQKLKSDAPDIRGRTRIRRAEQAATTSKSKEAAPESNNDGFAQLLSMIDNNISKLEKPKPVNIDSVDNNDDVLVQSHNSDDIGHSSSTGDKDVPRDPRLRRSRSGDGSSIQQTTNTNNDEQLKTPPKSDIQKTPPAKKLSINDYKKRKLCTSADSVNTDRPSIYIKNAEVKSKTSAVNNTNSTIATDFNKIVDLEESHVTDNFDISTNAYVSKEQFSSTSNTPAEIKTISAYLDIFGSESEEEANELGNFSTVSKGSKESRGSSNNPSLRSASKSPKPVKLKAASKSPGSIKGSVERKSSTGSNSGNTNSDKPTFKFNVFEAELGTEPVMNEANDSTQENKMGLTKDEVRGVLAVGSFTGHLNTPESTQSSNHHHLHNQHRSSSKRRRLLSIGSNCSVGSVNGSDQSRSLEGRTKSSEKKKRTEEKEKKRLKRYQELFGDDSWDEEEEAKKQHKTVTENGKPQANQSSANQSSAEKNKPASQPRSVLSEQNHQEHNSDHSNHIHNRRNQHSSTRKRLNSTCSNSSTGSAHNSAKKTDRAKLDLRFDEYKKWCDDLFSGGGNSFEASTTATGSKSTLVAMEPARKQLALYNNQTATRLKKEQHSPPSKSNVHVSSSLSSGISGDTNIKEKRKTTPPSSKQPKATPSINGSKSTLLAKEPARKQLALYNNQTATRRDKEQDSPPSKSNVHVSSSLSSGISGDTSIKEKRKTTPSSSKQPKATPSIMKEQHNKKEQESPEVIPQQQATHAVYVEQLTPKIKAKPQKQLTTTYSSDQKPAKNVPFQKEPISTNSDDDSPEFPLLPSDTLSMNSNDVDYDRFLHDGYIAAKAETDIVADEVKLLIKPYFQGGYLDRQGCKQVLKQAVKAICKEKQKKVITEERYAKIVSESVAQYRVEQSLK